MNNQTPYERHRQLREVAILVASLAEPMAQRVLDSMPVKDAEAVLAEVEVLEYIDPEEQREVVEKFRQSITPEPKKKVDGVELDASLLAKLEEPSSRDEFEITTAAPPKALPSLSESGAAAIVKMLSAEHPQTIATVLSRLNADQAAQLMGKLSLSLQAEVLARMGNLDTSDELAVQVIEQQLANWIEQQQQREHRQAAGMELVQRILDHTPEDQRQTILAHMGRNSPLPPTQAKPVKPNSAPIAEKTSNSFTLTYPSKNEIALRTEVNKKSQQVESEKPQSTNKPAFKLSADPLSELEKTNSSTLRQALSQSDRQISSLALAGASDVLMKRILRGMPRRQAKTMRQQLRSIGPTRLSDMLNAQQQLLQTVKKIASN